MTYEPKLSRSEWQQTPCPVPGHFHNGPEADCYETMRKLEALGPDAIRCARCGTPTLKRQPCLAGCGMDYTPKPKPPPLTATRKPLGKYQSDGHGCVERVHPTERYWEGQYG